MKPSTLVSSSLIVLLAVAGNASGQTQDSGQQRCLNKSSGSARKVTSSTIKNAADCLKRGSGDDLPDGVTAQDCLGADLKGKIAKARTKVSGQVTSYCGATTTPDFGFTDATTLNDYHEHEGVGFVPDCFGPDLDAAIAGPLMADPRASCSSGVLGQSAKVADAMLKVFLDCMKSGLKDGTIADGAALEACLDSITLDARGRVAKAVGRLQSKLESSACPATPGDLFPVLDGPGELCDRYGLTLPLNAANLASCLGKRMACRVCRIVNGSNGFDHNCDLFDDGSIDATCPACPNGMTDAGEECDDGNAINGDGCTDQCVLEFCGDGVVNDGGVEQCDDGPANSDSTPNACRADCTLPTCGDLVVDDQYSEDCDEGGVATATCDADCTLPECGDGVTNPANGEECDDGNPFNTDACVACQNAECGDGFTQGGVEDCDGGECCTGLCEFSAPGSACTGAVSSCVTPQCNGAGACSGAPANEGMSCDDGNVCTTASSCVSGECAADAYTGVGKACEWVVVGSSTNDTEVQLLDEAVSVGGDWCGWRGRFDVNSVVSQDIVTTGFDSATGRAILFGPTVTVNGGDILSNNRKVESDPVTPVPLPGIAAASVAAGQHVNKTPAPTFYDTTGTDPRVATCAAAQADLLPQKAILDGLASTANLGTTLEGLDANGETATVNAVNVGGVNVFDMANLNGTGTGVSITLNGGGNANTVFVMRISNRLNTGANWTFNLTGGLTYDHLLFYVSKITGDESCALGLGNTGGGTLFCPRLKIHVNGDTQWQGAAYGGASGTNGDVRIGLGVTFTYAPFTAALP